MCIIADDVKFVGNTKIASFHVAYSLDGGRTVVPSQLVVYSASIDSNKPNALILPVYNPGNDHRNIIPLDLSRSENFFNVLEDIYSMWGVNTVVNDTRPKTRSLFNSNSMSNNLLSVHTVGNYRFSIMPSKIDFNRLDRTQLNISPAAKTAIDAHSNEYSFIVYQFFDTGNIKVSPFGYLCKPIDDNNMIIPTIHGHSMNDSYHDMFSIPFTNNFSENNSAYFPIVSNIGSSINESSDFESVSEYDHKIFTLNKIRSGSPASPNIQVMMNLTKTITKDYMKRNIDITFPRNCYPCIYVYKGKHANRNALVTSQNMKFVHDLIFDEF